MGYQPEKREINYQRRAFEISIALHVLIISLVFSMSNAFVHKDNFIVIDFTLEDSLNVEAGTSKNIKSEPLRKPEMSNKVGDVESRETPVEEKKSPIEDIMAKIEPAEIQDVKPTPPEETQPHGVSFTEQSTAYEDKNIQDTAPATSVSSSYGSGGSMNGDMKKINVKSAYGAGSGNSIEGKKTGYLRANFSYIKDMIEKRITYPQNARRMGWKGKVKVSFIITSSGEVRGITIIQSSGYRILDSNVIEAVKDASPFPKPPVEAQIIIPIVYSLH
jgi:protein TonB